MLYPLIAFAGYAGAGKDEAAVPLLLAGYTRCCLGDIIKRQLNALVMQHMGFSAHTDDRAQKARIRRTLENWGEDNYDAIIDELFRELEPPSVNTRLVRIREARRWKSRGGIIVMIDRPGVRAATMWEHERLCELRPHIDLTIENAGSVEDLHQFIRDALL